MYRHLGLGGVSPFFCFSASLAFAQSCSDCNTGVQWARGSCTCLWWAQGERRPPSPLSNVPGSLVGSRSVRLTARDTTKTRTCRTWRKSSASVASAWRRSYIASCTRGTSCMPWRAKVRCPLLLAAVCAEGQRARGEGTACGWVRISRPRPPFQGIR